MNQLLSHPINLLKDHHHNRLDSLLITHHRVHLHNHQIYPLIFPVIPHLCSHQLNHQLSRLLYRQYSLPDSQPLNPLDNRQINHQSSQLFNRLLNLAHFLLLNPQLYRQRCHRCSPVIHLQPNQLISLPINQLISHRNNPQHNLLYFLLLCHPYNQHVNPRLNHR